MKKPPVTKETRRTIKAGEIILFEEEFDVDFGEDIDYSYKVTPESIKKQRVRTVAKPVTVYFNQTICE